MRESKEPGKVAGRQTVGSICGREAVEIPRLSQSGLKTTEYLTALEAEKANEEGWKRVVAQIGKAR